MKSSYGILSRKAIIKNGPLMNFLTFMPCTRVQHIAGHIHEITIYSLMPRRVPSLTVSIDQVKQIEQWLSAQGTPQQVVLRCRIIST